VVAVAGGLCGAFIRGSTGQALAAAFLSLGLGGIVMLVFLEVGLSEDRARAREEERQRKRALKSAEPPRRPRRTFPRRPG